MTAVLTTLASAVIVAVACWWVAHTPMRRPRPDGLDADWGSWPLDQMAP